MVTELLEVFQSLLKTYKIFQNILSVMECNKPLKLTMFIIYISSIIIDINLSQPPLCLKTGGGCETGTCRYKQGYICDPDCICVEADTMVSPVVSPTFRIQSPTTPTPTFPPTADPTYPIQTESPTPMPFPSYPGWFPTEPWPTDPPHPTPQPVFPGWFPTEPWWPTDPPLPTPQPVTTPFPTTPAPITPLPTTPAPVPTTATPVTPEPIPQPSTPTFVELPTQPRQTPNPTYYLPWWWTENREQEEENKPYFVGCLGLYGQCFAVGCQLIGGTCVNRLPPPDAWCQCLFL